MRKSLQVVHDCVDTEVPVVETQHVVDEVVDHEVYARAPEHGLSRGERSMLEVKGYTSAAQLSAAHVRLAEDEVEPLIEDPVLDDVLALVVLACEQALWCDECHSSSISRSAWTLA